MTATPKTEVYTIESIGQFHQYLPLLKEDASINSVPNIYLIGFDAEYISCSNFPDSVESRTPWVYATPKNTAVCLIQMASPNVCLIINLVKMGLPLPKKLIQILKSESWTKVGVGVELDLTHLSDNYQLGHCSGGIEIKNLALMAGYPKCNLEYLYNKLLGKAVQKPNSVCDWSQELTLDQIEYAAKDAIMSFQLFNKIMSPCIDRSNDIDIEDISFNVSFNKPEKVGANYISQLNEWAQQHRSNLPVYQDIRLREQEFKIICCFQNIETYGISKSKKDAKQLAAKQMYEMCK